MKLTISSLNLKMLRNLLHISSPKKPIIDMDTPAGTRRCDTIGFWLSFCSDVGQRQSNVVTTLSFSCCFNLTFITTSYFRRHFSDQILTF